MADDGKRWDNFEEGPVSIYQRFPGLTGRKLQNQVWKIYVVEEQVTLPFFTPSGMASMLL